MGKKKFNGEVIKEEKEMIMPAVEDMITMNECEEPKTVEHGKNREALYGVISKSGNLNLRERPSKDSKILAVLPAGSEVLILDDKDDIFYHVCLSTGVEGYCMKDYIILK